MKTLIPRSSRVSPSSGRIGPMWHAGWILLACLPCVRLHAADVPSSADSQAQGFVRSLTKEEVAILPQTAYAGSVIVPATEEELKSAVARIEQETLLGFDMEARPSFKKGEHHPPSLIQLATADAVYLIRLNQLPFSPEIRAVLSKPSILKVGVGASADMVALQELQPFTAAGVVDLDDIAVRMGIQQPSLRGLAALLLKIRISKKEQLSNWEAPQLTPAQVSYAATDAWVGRELYRRMVALGYGPTQSIP